MKRNYLIPTPDWTSKTSVLTAACRVCGLSLGELRERLRTAELHVVAAELLGQSSAETLKQWQPEDVNVVTQFMRDLFIETNPLRAARRSSGLNVTEFAKMLGISRQRLHVLERTNGGEALLRACARAEAAITTPTQKE